MPEAQWRQLPFADADRFAIRPSSRSASREELTLPPPMQRASARPARRDAPRGPMVRSRAALKASRSASRSRLDPATAAGLLARGAPLLSWSRSLAKLDLKSRAGSPCGELLTSSSRGDGVGRAASRTRTASAERRLGTALPRAGRCAASPSSSSAAPRLTLAEIATSSTPASAPTQRWVARLSPRQRWARRHRRADSPTLERLKAGLTECIGCGCLSLDAASSRTPATAPRACPGRASGSRPPSARGPLEPRCPPSASRAAR